MIGQREGLARSGTHLGAAHPPTRRRLLSMALAAVGASGSTALADLGTPTGPVLLTVTGDLKDKPRVEFDLDMLRALPASTINTSTPWTDGVEAFTGVTLRAFLDALGVVSGSLHCLALNDYAVEIPIEDAERFEPIIAYLRNGQVMTRRNKGPLWMIYPFDRSPSLQQEHINARSIWHLTQIEVRS